LFAVLSLLITCSCNGLLDKEPLGRLDAGYLFPDQRGCLASCEYWAYRSLLINNENNNYYWVLGTVASDDAIAGGDGSRPGINEIDIMDIPLQPRN
jgi:hypothetical protein